MVYACHWKPRRKSEVFSTFLQHIGEYINLDFLKQYKSQLHYAADTKTYVFTSTEALYKSYMSQKHILNESTSYYL